MPLSPASLKPLSGSGLIRSLLFGQGRGALLKSVANPIVSETGAFAAPAVQRGALGNTLHTIKSMLVGDRPLQQMSQRFTQGGVFGHGGLVHGSMALDPQFAQTIRRQGLLKAVAHSPQHAVGAAINPAFMVGIPAYAAMKAKERGESPGRALGEGLAFSVASPLNMLAMLPARVGGSIGERMLPGPQVPPIQSMEGMYDQYPQEKMSSVKHVLTPAVLAHRPGRP